jgi:hypothetical protein
MIRRPLLDVGYVTGMTGSVLWDGTSNKDLDIIVFPLTTEKQDVEAVHSVLKSCGLRLGLNREQILKIWRRKGSLDNKHVEYWDYRGRRVDIFYLS